MKGLAGGGDRMVRVFLGSELKTLASILALHPSLRGEPGQKVVNEKSAGL
jgi:hypothetical protein